jgi:hypothetical protein
VRVPTPSPNPTHNTLSKMLGAHRAPYFFLMNFLDNSDKCGKNYTMWYDFYHTKVRREENVWKIY